MPDELLDRQQAIVLRLAGHSVRDICRRVGHSREWFHRWWRRYTCPIARTWSRRRQASRASAGRAAGPDGLWEQTRAAPVSRRLAADLERTILMIRRRIESRTHPGTRYSLIGAQAIVAELEALQIQPVPSLRTIERVLQRNGVTVPCAYCPPYTQSWDKG